MLGSPPLPHKDQEATLFKASFTGPDLEQGWQWVREDAPAWNLGCDGIALTARPGGIWGQVFADIRAPPLLLRPLEKANACEVTVAMPPTPGQHGEQAGLFWYVDDNNYAKLVVEWGSEGTASVVLAREQDGTPAVVGKAALEAEEAVAPIRLRLELSADGSQLSGVVVGAYYMRLVGSCSAVAGIQGGSSPDVVSPSSSIGVAFHGGGEAGFVEGRVAHLSDFASIAVRPNRVQWTGGATAAAIAHAQPLQQAGYAPPAPGAGLTLSPDLSEEERAQVAALLGGMGGAVPYEAPCAEDGQQSG